LELGATRLAEVEKADADKAMEITLLRKALQAVERKGGFWRRRSLQSVGGRRRSRLKF